MWKINPHYFRSLLYPHYLLTQSLKQPIPVISMAYLMIKTGIKLVYFLKHIQTLLQITMVRLTVSG